MKTMFAASLLWKDSLSGRCPFVLQTDRDKDHCSNDKNAEQRSKSVWIGWNVALESLAAHVSLSVSMPSGNLNISVFSYDLRHIYIQFFLFLINNIKQTVVAMVSTP